MDGTTGRLGIRATVNAEGQHLLELFDGSSYRTVLVEDGHRLAEWLRGELRALHDTVLGANIASDPQPENDPGADGRTVTPVASDDAPTSDATAAGDGSPPSPAASLGDGSVPAPAVDPASAPSP